MKRAAVPSILVAVVLLAFGVIADAQQPKKVPRIGVLVSASASASVSRIHAFRQGLHALGYIEGKNIIIEYRYAEGNPNRLQELVAELVRLKVDVIVTDTSRAIDAAKNATKTIPVVFTSPTDPVGDGQVSSLAQPGGNLTGLSILAPELNGKRLELLKETLPKVTRVAYITREGGHRGRQRFEEAEVVAKGMGLRLQFFEAQGVEDLDSAFDAAKRSGAQALTFPPTTFLFTNRAHFINASVKNRLPAIYPGTPYAEEGGLMSYGPDIPDNWRRVTIFIDKILKGRTHADLPVEQPTKFEFIINLKAAKQIGLTIPPNVLARADKVIR
jgi:putative ABC transport system substrate-binding protein